MTRAWFITGTDTGVGKTRVACGMLRALAREGHAVVGMKPVATGCRAGAGGLRNDDAEALLACSTVPVAYGDINPYAFADATAPHLAARAAGTSISIDTICAHYRRLAARADAVVMEGVGGWRVPLGGQTTLADVVQALHLPVILVVGIRLGAMNHAQLTLESMQRADVTVHGWVANRLDPDPLLNDYPCALQELLDVPLLAEIPYRAASIDNKNPSTAPEFDSAWL